MKKRLITFVLSLAWRVYAAWSNFYRRHFEADQIEEGKIIWESYIEPKLFPHQYNIVKAGGNTDTYWKDRKELSNFFYSVCENLTLYMKDKWYMGFDVCSHPMAFLGRRDGDCDDHAAFARKVLGFGVKTQGDGFYMFDGLYTIVWTGPFVGHVIGVWTTLEGKVMISDGKVIDFFNSFDAFMEEFATAEMYGSPKSKLLAIGKFKVDAGEDLRFDTVKYVRG